jgi:hypothetical protein
MVLKTKNVISKSMLKEPIGFEMMMPTAKVNIFGGKGTKILFEIVFSTYVLTHLFKFHV